MVTVTNGKWCVSYTTGSGIPSGLVRLSVYYYEGDKIVYAPEDDMILTRDKAEEICLKKGYLIPFEHNVSNKKDQQMLHH